MKRYNRFHVKKVIPKALEEALTEAVFEKQRQLAKLGIGADSSLEKADNTYKIMLLVGGGIAGTWFLVKGSPLTGIAIMAGSLFVGGLLEQSGKI